MILPDDVVELSARALSDRYAAASHLEKGTIRYNNTPAAWQSFARAALEAARYGEMREALKQCTDSLEAELQARYPVEAEGHAPYPTMKRRYDRDMAEVVKARTLLSTIGDPTDIGASQS